MTGPILRICPACGHENWGISVPTAAGTMLNLPPPATCEECEANLVPRIRHVDRYQSIIPGTSLSDGVSS